MSIERTERPRPGVAEIPAEATRAILAHLRGFMRHAALWHEPDFLGVDVTMVQAKCLFVVSLHPGIRISALADQLQVGLSAASGLVDRLVEGGYLDRHEDPADRRQQLVSVTSTGRSVIERIREFSAERFAELLRGLSSAELDALRTGMAALEREAGHSVPDDASDVAHHERTPA